jgi:hypothetical protein
MKIIQLLLILFLAQQVDAQKYILGIELSTFSIGRQIGSSKDQYANAFIDANYNANKIVISPLLSFQVIRRNNFLQGFELGYYKFKENNITVFNDLTNAKIEKRDYKYNRHMFILNFNCSKKVHFDQFVFIAGVYLPFTYSPKYTYLFDQTVQDAKSNQITFSQKSTNQYPNYLATGIRFKTELNYPIYKKLYVASKLNFGFDYEHYFGKVNSVSDYFDGNTTTKSTREINYKSLDLFSKHFSFGVGLNYFL